MTGTGGIGAHIIFACLIHLFLSKGGVRMSEVDHPLSEPDQSEDDKVTPRGATAFVFVMLAGYILYWAYLWYTTIIERGVGG
jgi:hypothetical protein